MASAQGGHDGAPGTAPAPLREDVSKDAARLAESARQRLDKASERPKEAVAGAARSATSALEQAAGALRHDEAAPDWLAKGFETAARQIANFAETLEGKKLDDLTREVTRFARTNPLVFLAASAAAGFAAARFLRAGSEYQTEAAGGAGDTGPGPQGSSPPPSSRPSLASADTPIYGAATSPDSAT